jgi:predicted RNase H-like nuclease (RuvC/YqgF family)
LLYQKKKEAEVEEVSTRLRELGREHTTLKDTMDQVSREYYTFQKKKEVDSETVNEKIKELTKKIEKKDQKIEELNE